MTESFENSVESEVANDDASSVLNYNIKMNDNLLKNINTKIINEMIWKK